MREKRWTRQANTNKRQKRDVLLHRPLNKVSDSFRRHTQVRSALVGVAVKKKVTDERWLPAQFERGAQ
jgi:hypothetical protein